MIPFVPFYNKYFSQLVSNYFSNYYPTCIKHLFNIWSEDDMLVLYISFSHHKPVTPLKQKQCQMPYGLGAVQLSLYPTGTMGRAEYPPMKPLFVWDPYTS